MIFPPGNFLQTTLLGVRIGHGEVLGGIAPPFILDGSGHYIFGFRVITIAQSTLFASFVVRVK